MPGANGVGPCGQIRAGDLSHESTGPMFATSDAPIGNCDHKPGGPLLRDQRTLIAPGQTVPADRPASPLSVAYVCPGWPPDAFANGIIPYISMIAEELREAGHRATILASRVAGEIHDADVIDLGSMRPRRTPARRLFDVLAFRVAPKAAQRRQYGRALIAAARRAIDERGVRIIEMEEAFGLARWLKQELSIPIVVRLHGPWFLNGPMVARVDRGFRERVDDEGEAIRLADAVTSPSRDVLEKTRAYYGLPLASAGVIPPPTVIFPADARWRLEDCTPDQILFIGRFDRHKGGDLIIDAFTEVAPEFPKARLRFVGPDVGLLDDDGRHWQIAEYIRHRLPDASDSGRVEWMGKRPYSELAKLRREAMVTVVSSRYETFGLTLTEAMALGCPTVATRAGAFPEIIQDGVNGLLCEPEDAKDLAAKICRILGDASLAARLGYQAGLDCERRYDARLIANRLVEVYRRVIEGRA